MKYRKYIIAAICLAAWAAFMWFGVSPEVADGVVKIDQQFQSRHLSLSKL